MKKLLIVATIGLLLFSCNDKKGEAEKTAGTTTTDTTTKMAPAEFADAKYMDIGKKMLGEFESNNISEWMKGYADSAVYNWSAGDSLVGKAAIEKYWSGRRGDVIDSIKFSNDIWIPIKINTPQKGPDAPGVWLLSWYQVNVKYKSGKSLQFWTHSDHHFNANDKIDRTVQYIDRAPINAAIK